MSRGICLDFRMHRESRRSAAIRIRVTFLAQDAGQVVQKLRFYGRLMAA